MPDFHVTFRDLLHAVTLRQGTNGFTSLPREGVLRIFFALKNPTASVRFEPANLGTKGQHATCRPPTPLKITSYNLRNTQHTYLFGYLVFYQTKCQYINHSVCSIKIRIYYGDVTRGGCEMCDRKSQEQPALR